MEPARFLARKKVDGDPTGHGDASQLKSVDEIPSSERLRRFETNAAAAAFVAVSAIALDALSAIPPTLVRDVPSSLRCLSLVLVFVLGSPIVTPDSTEIDLEWSQRGIALFALIASAAVGEHASAPYVRVADAIFVLVTGFGAVFLFVYRSTRPVPGSALFGALLCYVGLRAIRAGLVHASEAAAFTVSGDAFETRGFAINDTVASTAIAFSGSMLAATGVLILLNTKLIGKMGTAAVSPLVAMNASMAFAATLVAQLSVYSRIEDLPSLFGTAACVGGEGACEAAFRARRMYIANSSPASLWAGVVAASIFALPKQRRCSTRIVYYTESRFSGTSGTVAVLVSAVAVVSTVAFAGDESLILAQVEIVLLFASIPVAWFVSTPLGCVLSFSGNLLYVGSRFDGVGSLDFDFYTNWSLCATALFTLALFVTTGISRILFLFAPPMHAPAVEIATGMLVSAALSTQLALTLATLSLIVGYDGSQVNDGEASWREAGFEFTVQHLFSFFFVSAVYGSRYELGDPSLAIGSPKVPIPVRLRRIAWFFCPPVLGSCWAIRLTAEGWGSPYNAFTSAAALGVALAAAFIPWLVVGLGV
jgi:hypothetical protein